MAFLAPSVTPWYPSTVLGGTAINPSIRLYEYNTSVIVDYTQYHLNLTRVNGEITEVDDSDQDQIPVKYELSQPQWELYYQARRTFGLQSLDAVSMTSLYDNLNSDDILFQKYYLINSAGYNNGICDSLCKKSHLCAIANVKIKNFSQCIGNSQSSATVSHITSTTVARVPVYVMEDGFPVSAESSGTSSNSSHAIIAAIALSMTLTVILAFILAVMLVMITMKRNRMLNTDSSLPVADLTWGRRHNKYRQLP